jgi:hypothetical protein
MKHMGWERLQRHADGRQLATELLRAFRWQLPVDEGVDFPRLRVEQTAEALGVVTVAHQGPHPGH